MQIRAHSGRRRQRGNAIIETAIVFTPLMALMFAFIDHGLVLFLQSTFQHAVREGVRYAVTYQVITRTADDGTTTTLAQDASIKATVQKNAMGFLNGYDDCIKIRYYSPNDLTTEVSDNSPNNVVEVSIEGYTHKWLAPLWRAGGSLAITARAADRMEGLAGGATAPARY